MTAGLRAPHEMRFAFRRSVGGAERRFLSGLARAELWGSRLADGRIAVPPLDRDPDTGIPITEFVPVADVGVVRSWTWVAEPEPAHPLDRPFAYALIELDGADTAFLHVVDTEAVEMSTGMRVRADWRPERTGSVLDIRAFVPLGGDPRSADAGAEAASASAERVEDASELEVETRRDVRYEFVPGLVASRFLEALAERRILGGRCVTCGRVYVPPRVRCPVCGSGPMSDVEVPERGTVSAYTIVHVPGGPAERSVPFAAAWIRLDGTDVSFPHLLDGATPADVAVGLRVQAVWVGDAELAPTWESIAHFAPIGPEGDQACDG